MEAYSATQPQSKTATFRQSGWKELATGMIHCFYSSDVPPQDGTFVKLWDNMITTTSTSIPYVAPVEPVAPQ